MIVTCLSKIEYFREVLSDRIKAWVLLLILSVIWGSSYILIKMGVQDPLGNERIPPIQLGALRLTIAFIILSPFAFRSIRKVKKKDLPFIALSGIFGNGLPAFLYAYAEKQLDSTITGMLNSLVPIFVIIISAAIFSFKIKWNHLVGLSIGIIGAFLIVYEKIFGIAFSKDDMIPLLMVVGATICYATSLNIIKYKLAPVSSIAITSLSFGIIGPFCLTSLFFTDFVDRVQHQENILPGIAAVSTLAVIGTAMAVLLFNYMIKISSPIFASSVTYFIPIVVIFLGILYGEKVSTLEISGIVVLIIGVLILNKKTKRVSADLKD